MNIRKIVPSASPRVKTRLSTMVVALYTIVLALCVIYGFFPLRVHTKAHTEHGM